MNRFYRNNTVFFLFLFLLLLVKIPILNLPYHWDAMGYEIPYAMAIKSDNFDLVPEDVFNDTGQPVLFPLFLAIVFKLCGAKSLVGHFVVIVFSSLSLFYVYLLGKFLKSRKAGFIAASLLFFFPHFFSLTGIVSKINILTTFVIISVYYGLKCNKGRFLIAAICLVLSNHSGMYFLLAIFIYKYLIQEKFSKKSFVYLSPAFFYLGWLIFHKFQTGWMFPIQRMHDSVWGRADLIKSVFFFIFSKVFIENYIWILLIVIFVFLVFYFKDMDISFKKHFFFLMILISGYIVLLLIKYIIGSIFLPRYLLPLYPLLFVLCGISLDVMFTDNKKIIIFLVGIIFVFTTQWNLHRVVESDGAGAELETNLEYIDMVKTHQEACAFIEDRYSDSVVLTTWPMTTELMFPYLGYVNKSIKCYAPFNYELNEEGSVSIKIKNQANLRNVDLVYFSPQSHGYKAMLRLMSSMHLKYIKQFSRDNKTTQIFKVIKSNLF